MYILHSFGTRFSKNLKSFFDTYGTKPDFLKYPVAPVIF